MAQRSQAMKECTEKRSLPSNEEACWPQPSLEESGPTRAFAFHSICRLASKDRHLLRPGSGQEKQLPQQATQTPRHSKVISKGQPSTLLPLPGRRGGFARESQVSVCLECHGFRPLYWLRVQFRVDHNSNMHHNNQRNIFPHYPSPYPARPSCV